MTQAILSLPWILIFSVSSQLNVDPMLLGSILFTESSGKQNVIRKYDNKRYFDDIKYFANRLGIDEIDELIHQSHAWGIGQITGNRARELGYTGYLKDLTDIETNVWYSALYLANLGNIYAKEKNVIVSYNAGSPRYYNGKLIKKSRRYLRRVIVNKKRIVSVLMVN